MILKKLWTEEGKKEFDIDAVIALDDEEENY